jgi:DHA1 family bicyclomycin/chloramphenicol resistance-like MFS transporter
MDASAAAPAQVAAAGRSSPHPGVGFREFVALLAGLMALNALSVDVMLPGLSAIDAALGVADDNDRQLVLGVYLVGFAAAQLVWGPLADRYGRKSTLLVGLGLYVVASVAAAFAPGFAALLAARLAQGLAAASTRVVALALVRDCYTGRGMGRVMSLVMMVFMIVPILAPSIGQLILLVAPWRWMFGLLVVGGVVMLLWAANRLPETLRPEHRRRLRLAPLLAAYREIFANRVTCGYMLALGVIFGALFGFLTSAQQVMQEVFGLGLWFTVAFAGIAGLMSAASFTNARLVTRLGMRKLGHGALLGFTALGALQFALAAAGIEQFAVFFVLQSAAFFFFGFIGANFNALAMEPMGHIAGTAASLVGFTQTFLGAVLGSLVGQAYDGTAVPLTAGFALLGLATLAIVAVTERGRLMRAQPR